MDLTIMIPVYRNESTIGRTLASIDSSWSAAGEPSGLHVIVVIDGIVDFSIDVVHGWAGTTALPTTVIVQENAGLGNARNVGWRAASTTWITFLDADDEITPERLDYAKNDVMSGAAYIGCQVFEVSDGLRIPGLPDGYLAGQGPTRFHPISMLIEVSIVNDIGGFNPSYHAGNDWDFAVRLRERGVTMEYVDQPFVIRHIHGANLTMNESAAQRDYLRAIREHRKRKASPEGAQPE